MSTPRLSIGALAGFAARLAERARESAEAGTVSLPQLGALLVHEFVETFRNQSKPATATAEAAAASAASAATASAAEAATAEAAATAAVEAATTAAEAAAAVPAAEPAAPGLVCIAGGFLGLNPANIDCALAAIAADLRANLPEFAATPSLVPRAMQCMLRCLALQWVFPRLVLPKLWQHRVWPAFIRHTRAYPMLCNEARSLLPPTWQSRVEPAALLPNPFLRNPFARDPTPAELAQLRTLFREVFCEYRLPIRFYPVGDCAFEVRRLGQPPLGQVRLAAVATRADLSAALDWLDGAHTYIYKRQSLDSDVDTNAAELVVASERSPDDCAGTSASDSGGAPAWAPVYALNAALQRRPAPVG